MCGLLGYDLRNANLSKEQRAIMAAVLSIGNDHRGGDSYGYYNFMKTVRGLGDLADHAIDMFRNKFVMAHTRKATQGSVSVENAHPFEVGKIIGAHNGIISNHVMLNNKYKRECVVDSQHIFHHLNEDKELNDIHGYGVITWIDKTINKHRVYLCKLGAGGDLAIFGIGKGPKEVRGVIWSSDDDHIKAAVQAAHIEGFFYKIEPNKVYYVEEGHLIIDDKKLEINRDTSRDWRNGFNQGWEGYEYSGMKSGSDDASTSITQDDQLDKIIAHFKEEEEKREEDVVNAKAETSSEKTETVVTEDEKTTDTVIEGV
jgi:uncharacterized protein YeeX (DUF496 family)